MSESSARTGRFEDKVAIVSGAASGIGRATAVRIASEGGSVLCTDVQAEALQETVKLATEAGGAASAALCDVSDPTSVEAAVATCRDTYGRIDALCNVAGILRFDHAHELALEDWNRVLSVNLTGTFLMCKAALPHLLETKGAIVNTSSTSALAGLAYGAAYGASKAGVLGLTYTLSIEYGKQGVRTNAVCPGSITTPMTTSPAFPDDVNMKLITRAMPLDAFRGPETVASVIAFLASADAAHINGERIRVDGATLS